MGCLPIIIMMGNCGGNPNGAGTPVGGFPLPSFLSSSNKATGCSNLNTSPIASVGQRPDYSLALELMCGPSNILDPHTVATLAIVGHGLQ